jgi:hypothetical protein
MSENPDWGANLPGLLALAGILAYLVLIIWIVVEYYTYIKFEGKTKRGIMMWSEPLPIDVERFLRELPRSLLSKRSGKFIKKLNDTVLIQGIRVKPWWKRGRNTPCVAYIDLCKEKPRIEYRNPISTTLFLIAWIGISIYISCIHAAALIFTLVGLVGLVVPLLIQRGQIRGFIDRTMRRRSGTSHALSSSQEAA